MSQWGHVAVSDIFAMSAESESVPELLSTTAVAERISVLYGIVMHPAEVRLWVESGAFPATRVGTYYVIEWTVVRDWWEEVCLRLAARITEVRAARERIHNLVQMTDDDDTT
jgi:hypothetical protein